MLRYMRETEAASSSQFASAELHKLQEELREHPLYMRLRTPKDIQTFMEHHVFAVWDFMSLVKKLQRTITCVDLPWRPVGSPAVRRFINEVVLGEESDMLTGNFRRGLTYASHFELYRLAMERTGAGTDPIDRLLLSLAEGVGLDEALQQCGGPTGAVKFTSRTLKIATEAETHIVAAEFAFGREESIPVMFRSVARVIRFGQSFDLLRVYLERHVTVDEGIHAQLAMQMLRELVDGDAQRRNEVIAAGIEAISERIYLWDAILRSLDMSPEESEAKPI